MGKCLLQSFILNVKHRGKYPVLQIDFVLHTHNYTSFNKPLEITAFICSLWCFCSLYTTTSTHSMLDASLSKAFNIKTLRCLVYDFLCVYKKLQTFLSFTTHSVRHPKSHLLAQQGRRRYSFPIPVAFVTPFIFHLYHFCVIRTRNKEFKVVMWSPSNSKSTSVTSGIQLCSVHPRCQNLTAVVFSAQTVAGLCWRNYTMPALKAFTGHRCECVLLTSCFVVRSSALNMLFTTIHFRHICPLISSPLYVKWYSF